MLKTRIITALVLIPLVLLALCLPDRFFSFASLFLAALIAWEYGKLIGMTNLWGRFAFLGLVVVSLFFGIRYIHTILQIGILWWLLATVLLFFHQKSRQIWQRSGLIRFAAGLVIIVPAVAGLVTLHRLDHNYYWLLFILAIVWSADIGAYFAGRCLGKHLLAPNISPKKTIEGFVGGFVLVMLISGLLWCFRPDNLSSYKMMLPLIVMSFLLSVVGDLTESAIKRFMGVKDSGSILPGHGGILDRLDSLLAVLPLFTFYLMRLL